MQGYYNIISSYINILLSLCMGFSNEIKVTMIAIDENDDLRN